MGGVCGVCRGWGVWGCVGGGVCVGGVGVCVGGCVSIISETSCTEKMFKFSHNESLQFHFFCALRPLLFSKRKYLD